MEYRLLGRSGLKVSTVTFGTMTFGGTGFFAKAGTTGVDDARRLLDVAIDHGVNFFNTANVYSHGVSEEILGQTIKGRRDRLLIASKVRMGMGDGPNDAGLSRKHIIDQCEASLRRLGTDHIDLYQVHEWDGLTPLEETLDALDSMVKAGKVRYIGSSNYAGWQLSKALGISERHGYQRFISQQIHYTLQAREAEYELLPIAEDAGVGVLVWSPLAAGLLSGKYRRGQQPPEGSRQLSGWGEPPVRDEDALYNIVDELVAIGDARGVSAARYPWPGSWVARAWPR
nr:aldo/keto reductase [Paracoccus versutus]